eukprot:767747-Hanusia_phi.AAC.4
MTCCGGQKKGGRKGMRTFTAHPEPRSRSRKRRGRPGAGAEAGAEATLVSMDVSPAAMSVCICRFPGYRRRPAARTCWPGAISGAGQEEEEEEEEEGTAEGIGNEGRSSDVQILIAVSAPCSGMRGCPLFLICFVMQGSQILRLEGTRGFLTDCSTLRIRGGDSSEFELFNKYTEAEREFQQHVQQEDKSSPDSEFYDERQAEMPLVPPLPMNLTSVYHVPYQDVWPGDGELPRKGQVRMCMIGMLSVETFEAAEIAMECGERLRAPDRPRVSEPATFASSFELSDPPPPDPSPRGPSSPNPSPPDPSCRPQGRGGRGKEKIRAGAGVLCGQTTSHWSL